MNAKRQRNDVVEVPLLEKLRKAFMFMTNMK